MQPEPDGPVDSGGLSPHPYMEVYMDLTKKTTILFSPELHRRLSKLAACRVGAWGTWCARRASFSTE